MYLSPNKFGISWVAVAEVHRRLLKQCNMNATLTLEVARCNSMHLGPKISGMELVFLAAWI